MRLFTSRLLSLIVLAGVVGMVGGPIATLDVLGQENDGAEATTPMPGAVPTATNAPASTTGDEPPTQAAALDEPGQTALSAAPADIDPLLPVSTGTSAPEPATLSPTETVPVADIAPQPANAIVPTELATDLPVIAAEESATATSTPLSQFISADLTTGSCGAAWSFQISGIVAPVAAPATITVFEGGADFAMDLQQPQTGSTAFYTRPDLNAFVLDSAVARISSAWAGAFTLLTFPCADFTPSPTSTATPSSQVISADMSTGSCGTNWSFQITGIVPPVTAPLQIAVFEGGANFDAPLEQPQSGDTALYSRDDLNSLTIDRATARISSAWTGTFSLLTFPCDPTPITTPTHSATATAGAPETILAELDLDACEGSDEHWTFALSNPVSLTRNPDTITLEFTPGGSASAQVGFFSENGGVFTSFYVSDQHLSDTLVSASAVVDSAVSYTFVLTQGPACPAEATSTPTTGASPTSTPTETPLPSATSTPTLTQDQGLIAAIIDLDACERNDDFWMFTLRNPVGLHQNPDSILVSFIGGPSVIVPLGGTSEVGGVFTSIYFWEQNLDGAVQAAEAVVNASLDYAFALVSGPSCASDAPATATETATSSPTSTVTATFTATATSTATETSTATATTTASPIATATSTSSPSISPSATASATLTRTPTATSTPTSTASAHVDPATLTVTPSATATHPNDPPVWSTHTPGPGWTPTPPVGGLPSTGAGPRGSSTGTYGLLAITGAVILGVAIRRRTTHGV